jgi:glutamine cyclotransferase
MRPPSGGAGRLLRCLALVAALALAAAQACDAAEAPPPGVAAQPEAQPKLLLYEIVSESPHDPTAFLQGLQHDRLCGAAAVAANATVAPGAAGAAGCAEVWWESVGEYGASSVRLVDAASGRVLRRTDLAPQWFGEGLVKLGARVYQMTWQTPTIFVYDERLTQARAHAAAAAVAAAVAAGRGAALPPPPVLPTRTPPPTSSPQQTTHALPARAQLEALQSPLRDGWGLATDGEALIASDGSARLTWLDPATLAARRSVMVTDAGVPVRWLNELEWVNGSVWANVWQTECVAIIEPASGRVTSWLLLHGLRGGLAARRLPQPRGMDVLNGLAHDAASGRVWATGKLWPRIFEIRAVAPASQRDPRLADLRRRCRPR